MPHPARLERPTAPGTRSTVSECGAIVRERLAPSGGASGSIAGATAVGDWSEFSASGAPASVMTWPAPAGAAPAIDTRTIRADSPGFTIFTTTS